MLSNNDNQNEDDESCDASSITDIHPVLAGAEEPVESAIPTSGQGGSSFIDISLTRKAYQVVRRLNNAAELSHLLEESHHTGQDQKHHIKVPLNQLSVTRHMIDHVLRQIKINVKNGRGNYGSITIKNIRACLTKLH